MLNGVADGLSNGDAESTLHVKNTGTILELIWNIRKMNLSGIFSNKEILSTTGGFINSAANNAAGAADNNLKEKEEEKKGEK